MFTVVRAQHPVGFPPAGTLKGTAHRRCDCTAYSGEEWARQEIEIRVAQPGQCRPQMGYLVNVHQHKLSFHLNVSHFLGKKRLYNVLNCHF